MEWGKVVYRMWLGVLRGRGGRREWEGWVECVIIEDRELGKRGLKREVIGGMYWDVVERRMVGLKGVLVWDREGKRERMVEFWVDGEEGKKGEKIEGVRRKEGNGGFWKVGEEKWVVKRGMGEYKERKIEGWIEMVRDGMKKGMGFD